MKRQHTSLRDVEIEGRGLFTGEPVSVRMRPAPPNTGICFVRTDQSPPIRIEALVENVSKQQAEEVKKKLEEAGASVTIK